MDVVSGFKERAAGASATPNDKEVALVLRSLALSGPARRSNGSVKGFARDLWKNTFAETWRDARKSNGHKWDGKTFQNLLVGRNQPPDNDWTAFHVALAKECLRALGYTDISSLSPRGLIDIVREPASVLKDCVDRVFDHLVRARVNLRPQIDVILGGAPFWEDDTKWRGKPPPAPGEIVGKIVESLKTDGPRITYVQGHPFGAKRDILKGVVGACPDGYLMRSDGTRLPVLARAVGAISPQFFVDRVFNFFRGRDFDEPELRAALSTEGKIALIRAAAKREAALVVVSDIEPFDEDAIVRRLRGNLIGDVLQAIVEGNERSRLVIGLASTNEQVPWADRAKCHMMQPSLDEFSVAADTLQPKLANLVRLHEKGLSGITMRLAVPVIEAIRDGEKLPLAKFLQALERDKDEAVFELLWRHLASDSDRVLLGLISSSHDGLKLDVLNRIVGGLRRARRDDAVVQALPEGVDALRNWGNSQQAILRWRRESDADDTERSAGAFYFRDTVRRLVLKSWMQENPPLAREGMWFLAREAAEQARQAILLEGINALEAAMARNLQALYALTASLDAEKIDVAAATNEMVDPLHLDAQVLPPLSIVAPMPAATLAYRYAWSRLYRRDIEGGEQRLLSVYNDPLARLNALFLFIRPDSPWEITPQRSLCDCLADRDIKAALGAAGRGLMPVEQFELLSGIAIAAMRTGLFHLVRDTVVLGRRLRRALGDVAPVECMRLVRAEVDLGILCGGDPDVVVLPDFCTYPDWLAKEDGRSLNPSDTRFSLAGVAQRIEELVSEEDSRTPYNERDRHVIRGKLLARLGEVQTLIGNRKRAAAAFRRAMHEERRISNDEGTQLVPTATVIGGRGARSMARFALYRGVSAGFDPMFFPSDGLRWPAVRPMAADGRWLQAARTLVNINQARLSRGHLVDRFGLFVDEGRLAMAQGDLPLARRHLEQAGRTFSRGGFSFETLLELDMLRVFVAVEDAMRVPDAWAPTANAASLEQLGIKAAALAQALSLFAKPLEGLRFKVYNATLQFLRGQQDIVASRIAGPRTAERSASLLSAKNNLELALAQMEHLDYRIHEKRVTTTLKAVDAALGKNRTAHSAFSKPAKQRRSSRIEAPVKRPLRKRR